MAYFKFFFLFALVFAFVGFTQAGSRMPREVETATTGEGSNQLDKIQEQLMTAFDSFKKSMEEIASKINTDEIVQGVQSLTSKIEGYAKQAADQFATTAAGAANAEQAPAESS